MSNAKPEFGAELGSFLRALRGKSLPPNKPTGLPGAPTNADQAADGAYGDEGLSDPGLVNPVTGSGSGPVLR